MVYSNFLDTEEWKNMRLKIIKRDNYKCQAYDCKEPKKNLEVHHLVYFSFDKKPWEYSEDLLITLCNTCHKKESLRYIHEQSLLSALQQKGFLYSDLLAFTTMLYKDNFLSTELLIKLRNIQNG